MENYKVIIIGNGKPAIDCLRLLKRREHVDVSLVVSDGKQESIASRISTYCQKQGVPSRCATNANNADVVERVSELKPDLIVNVNSFSIIKTALLSIPKGGIINFHNGPLPRYAGVNCPSWAIINGEKEHGVTWHFVDEGIDTGKIIAQKRFKIDDNETAITLIFKCIEYGVKLFDEIIDDVLMGKLKGTPQSGPASYYSRKDIPNNGDVDFSWDYPKFDRFIRGLDFRPFPNQFTYPKVKFGDHEFILNSARYVKPMENSTHGEVLTVGADHMHVAINGSIVSITEVMDRDQNFIELGDLVKRYKIAVGSVLGI